MGKIRGIPSPGSRPLLAAYNKEKSEIGAINRRQENARQDYLLQELYFEDGDIDEAELAAAKETFDRIVADAQAEYETVFAQIQQLRHENERYEIVMETSQGQTKDQLLGRGGFGLSS